MVHVIYFDSYKLFLRRTSSKALINVKANVDWKGGHALDLTYPIHGISKR